MQKNGPEIFLMQNLFSYFIYFLKTWFYGEIWHILDITWS